jgi:DNA repair exonuclease SbcCD ATPase subunit
MATEPAAETELSVTLSPPLSEWLEERADALGVERETLLVQLLGTYRAAADIDEEELETLLSEAGGDPESTVSQDDLDDLDDRLEGLETDLSEHVEDLRSRILQLKDAVESSAKSDHDHPEIESLSERVETLSTDVRELETDLDDAVSEIGDVSSNLESLDERLGTFETKLDKLARVVVVLRRQAGDLTDSTETLEKIRRVANRKGTTTANCEACGDPVRIGLLDEAACPHCQHEFDDIEHPSSILARFKSPTLTREDAPPEENDDE